MSFIYSQEYNQTISNLPKLQELMVNQGIMLDAKYLPILEMAEEGDFGALCEMCTLFSDGIDSIKPNYEMAKRYAQKIHEVNLSTHEPVVILESLANLAMIEDKFGHKERAISIFKETFDHMMSNFYMKEVTEETHGFFLHIVSQFLDEKI